MSKPEAGQWEAEYKRLAEAVRFAIDYAGGRESEWGDRAEECFRILETAVSRKPNQPDPDEWVVQDRVPRRAKVDQFVYLSPLEMGRKVPEQAWQFFRWSSEVCVGEMASDGRKHGFVTVSGNTLHVRCRRRDLPPVEKTEPDHIADASKKVSDETELDKLKRHYEHRGRRLEALTKKVRTLRRALTDYKKAQDAIERERQAEWMIRYAESLPKKRESQPAKTRVRLWKWKYGGETRLSETAPSGDWVEVKHDAEGFYTL